MGRYRGGNRLGYKCSIVCPKPYSETSTEEDLKERGWNKGRWWWWCWKTNSVLLSDWICQLNSNLLRTVIESILVTTTCGNNFYTSS